MVVLATADEAAFEGSLEGLLPLGFLAPFEGAGAADFEPPEGPDEEPDGRAIGSDGRTIAGLDGSGAAFVGVGAGF